MIIIQSIKLKTSMYWLLPNAYTMWSISVMIINHDKSCEGEICLSCLRKWFLEGVYMYPKWNSRRLEISSRRDFFHSNVSFTAVWNGFLFTLARDVNHTESIVYIVYIRYRYKNLFETVKNGLSYDFWL